MTYYVSMTDSFMSGWGKARGKKAKFIYKCNDFDTARIVAQNARDRTDQKYVSISESMPRFSEEDYHIEWKTIEDSPLWYDARRPWQTG